MSIQIHHIENAPPALLDYMFYGSLIAFVVAFIIVFHVSRKLRPGGKIRPSGKPSASEVSDKQGVDLHFANSLSCWR
jgi:hypothetical protein